MIKYVLALLLAAAPVWAEGTTDATAKYIGRDFSPLIKPKTEFLGYIGKEYQRLWIRFTEVARDARDPAVYRVRGYSAVKGVRCDFTGTIAVRKIVTLDEMHYGVDDMLADAGLRAEGILLADYTFRENPAQPHAGIFRGEMRLDWYVDRDDLLLYDDISSYSDGYANNRYEGVWASYATPNATKKANWGEYRIPDSRDFDCGVGEFNPCKEYRNKGWRDYQPQKWTDVTP